jgi:hypothetical protein
MSADNVINEIRDSLNGRPGQPIVFGVCKSLADKFGKEPWLFRLVGFALNETEDRTRKFFSGLAVIIRDLVQKLAESLRDIFGPERA